MACRIVNLHSQPLRIDLRDQESLLLAPNERSRVLYEELLYDNHHITEWEQAGWLRRIQASMSELREEAAQSSAAASDKRAGKSKPPRESASDTDPASSKATGEKNPTSKTVKK